MATAEQIIRMKQQTEEMKWQAKLDTWNKISSLASRKPELYSDLAKAYKKPTRPPRNKG